MTDEGIHQYSADAVALRLRFPDQSGQARHEHPLLGHQVSQRPQARRSRAGLAFCPKNRLI